MTPLNVFLIGALLLLGRAVCAEVAGKTTYPQPQVYFNLTLEEHLAKIAEYAEIHSNRTAPSLGIQKRDPVGGETSNSALTNQMLQTLHDRCSERIETGYHAVSGHCEVPNIRKFRCADPNGPRGERGRSTSWTCPGTMVCYTYEAYNFRGNKVFFPNCGFTIPLKDRHDIGIHTEFEANWFPEAPKSPGTHDSFVQMAGQLTGYFDFSGTWPNGEGFSSRSVGAQRSWSCQRCPGGRLTITVKAVRSYALAWTHHNF